MNLDQQIADLIHNAPQDGTTPQLVEALAPALRTIATRLRHPQYYVVQTLEQGWMMLTLQETAEPAREKNVLYAFPTLKDVANGPYDLNDPGVMALPVPVTHILFQLFALPNVYSAIFFETPGNVAVGTEIQRSEVETLVHEVLSEQIEGLSAPEIPDDIA
jgi:hypothetical protein